MSEVKLWECPECGFGFDAIHEDVEGGCSCPVCELSEKEAEIEQLQDKLNQAIEALEFYEDIGNYKQPKPFYIPLVESDRGRVARKTLQSIKGGETDATQTSD